MPKTHIGTPLISYKNIETRYDISIEKNIAMSIIFGILHITTTHSIGLLFDMILNHCILIILQAIFFLIAHFSFLNSVGLCYTSSKLAGMFMC